MKRIRSASETIVPDALGDGGGGHVHRRGRIDP